MKEAFANSRLILESSEIESGSIHWRSPSNLALVKYWGKEGNQIPSNPSLSLTLDRAYTETKMSWKGRTSSDTITVKLSFQFEGREGHPFEERVRTYLESLIEYFPFIRQLDLKVETSNSFPHSSGIASSASSMSALALCLCSMEYELFDNLEEDEAFRRKASYIARLGSGSACRSIFPSAALWGKTGEIQGSSDEYAIPFEGEVHDDLKDIRDAILIVDTSEKSVPSSSGHGIMETHPYSEARFKQARRRLHELISALKKGDWQQCGRIAEAEAMTLHALMMSHRPPYTLLHPNTLSIMEATRAIRKSEDIPVYFSLDAGPNVHLLYPGKKREQVQSFIKERLLQYCEDDMWIDDKMGEGPLQL